MPSELDAAVEFFSGIPWTNALLTAPSTLLFIPHEPSPTAPPSQDILFSRILLTPSGPVTHQLALYHNLSTTILSSPSSGPRMPVDKVTILYSLTEACLGFTGAVHGGFIATLVDEAMGAVLYSNFDVLKKILDSGRTIPEGLIDVTNMKVFTVGVEIKFKKPIRTPRVVAVTAEVVRVEERKFFFEIEVAGEDVMYSTATGLWISAPVKQLKL